MINFEQFVGIVFGITIIMFMIVIGLTAILGLPALLVYELLKWSLS